MRIERLKVENVGGLPDFELEIPRQQMIAIAGANGTGKSKLLSALLTPWGAGFPVPRDLDEEATVSVSFEFNEDELAQFEKFDRQSNWQQGRPPKNIELVSTRTSIGNLERRTEGSHYHSILQGLQNLAFLKHCPSLNVIYLPAERRFHPGNSMTVDLSQLSEDVAVEKVASTRSASFGPGQLDDQEFESYAKALCVAGFLPSENVAVVERARSQWDKFRDSVDALLFPKKLLPLTAENPSTLRIGLPDGTTHDVSSLSSGERQALIIVSRVFRAGEGHSLVAIDEPDAYLHPSLSARLLRAIRPGLESGAGLLVATHSPSILDALPTAGIIRLRHDAPPALLESDIDRLDLYREAGFRASSLTQADLLVLTEGDFDATVLPLLIPELAAASIQPKGGREMTVQSLRTLAGYDLPIIGIVDADVLANEIPSTISDICHVWPVADIEAALLSDPAFIQAAKDGMLLQSPFDDVEAAQNLLHDLVVERKDEAISEYAQRILRGQMSPSWPSPRGSDAVERLRTAAKSLPVITESMVAEALSQAEDRWNAELPIPWTMVRGKWILGSFVSKATQFRSKDAFISAVAARKPRLALIQDLQRLIHQAMKIAA